MPTQWVMESDGSLVPYPHPFRDVTDDDVALAQKIADEIQRAKNDIELGFAKLAFLFDEVEKNKLYLAFGYETFRAWVESPEVEISYRVAHDLIRIRREVLPLLGENAEAKAGRIGVSKLRAMLPLLAEMDGKEKFCALADQLCEQPLSWHDVRAEVKRLRGDEEPLRHPVVFKAKVRRGGKLVRVEVTGTDGAAVTYLGTLQIPVEWWPRWSDRFGKFIEYVLDGHDNGVVQG